MSLSRQLWFLRRSNSKLPQIVIPLLAACVMVFSSFLPWLRDPLGKVYSAWSLPVDFGWEVHLGVFNYGLLCFICAIYSGLVAYAGWRPFKGSEYFLHKYRTAGLLCLVPLIIFLLQYLCIDVRNIDLLAQHKIQSLLISNRYGYTSSDDLIKIKALFLDISNIQDRAELLVDQAALGVAVPLISAWLLIDFRRLFAVPTRLSTTGINRKRRRFLIIAIAVLAVLVLRSLLGLVCEYETKSSLSSGDYGQALMYLNAAKFFNPALDQVAYYHKWKGEALYYLNPNQSSDDSRIYLASIYRSQNDYLDAYEQLLGTWQSEHTVSWAVSELSITLEGLAEYTHPLRGPLISRPMNDDTSLPWVQSLIQVDAYNVYGQYMAGRIYYDLHNYNGCKTQMTTVLSLSSDSSIQSSAYTYLGLGEIGLGDEAGGRDLIFKAITLDPYYHNNVAREELSGLR